MHKQKEALFFFVCSLRTEAAARGAATPPRCNARWLTAGPRSCNAKLRKSLLALSLLARSFCNPFFETYLPLQSPHARVIRTGGIKWNGEKSKNGTDNPFRLQSVPFLQSKNGTDTPFRFVISKRKLFFDSYCTCIFA